MPFHIRGAAPRLALVAAVALLAGSCADSNSADADGTSSARAPEAYTRLPPTKAIGDCRPGSGKTVRDGYLTIATDNPAYPPWFIDDDPANGKGFEGAVARVVSEKLGYSDDKVDFISVPFDTALEPGEKNFDFDINQFTIIDDRRQAVDFSSPYYAVAQSVVSMADNPAAHAESLAALSAFRLGAQRGSTSFTAIVETLHPAIAPIEFATNDEAKAALAAGQIDALVADIPTGFQIAASQVPGSVLVGQFPRPNQVTEFFGLVLEKGSPLTPCVTAAVDSLYADGTLDQLADRWIASTAGARVLE